MDFFFFWYAIILKLVLIFLFHIFSVLKNFMDRFADKYSKIWRAEEEISAKSYFLM